jgi:Uma2 family endonuclease
MTTFSSSATQPMTADELSQLPEDGYCCELVRGALVRDHPPGFRHGQIAQHLGALLWNWCQATGAGIVVAAETGFRLTADPDTVRAPDAAFVTRSRIPAGGGPDGYWDGAPDVAVEVLSPDARVADVQIKVDDYLDAGAQEVWVVNPQSMTVTIYRSQRDVTVLAEDDAFLGAGVVEGFAFKLSELFADA